jgi:hypothetical protein
MLIPVAHTRAFRTARQPHLAVVPQTNFTL